MSVNATNPALDPAFFDRKLARPYKYVPSEEVAITMIVLFGLSTIIHAGQSIYRRIWFLLPSAVFCGVLEVFGWAARLWSHYEPWNMTPFKIQMTCTIIGPTPLLGATFVVFGEIIKLLGTSYSRLPPRTYGIVFLTCELIALIVQGVGGGLAASADPYKGEDPEIGGRVMLGGIAFQLVTITVFSIMAIEYIVRYVRDTPVSLRTKSTEDTPRGVMTTKLTVMLGAMAFSTTALFIRAIYRTIELEDGWRGKIIRNELLFNVLDGAMVILAMYTLNIFHPAWLVFGQPKPQRRIAEKEMSSSESTINSSVLP